MLRFAQILAVNLLVFLVLLGSAELAYRIHVDGPSGAFKSIFSGVPYSNLGTHNWVVSDPALGYRLNPTREGINSLSIRHDEITIPKPSGLFRLVYLGDSIPWDKPGFVDYTEESLSQSASVEVINASTPGYTTYQESLFLETYVLQTSPDLVLLTYCMNDNHKFLHQFDENARMLTTKEAKDSLMKDSLFNDIVSRSYLLTRVRLALLSRRDDEAKFGWEAAPDVNIAWQDRPWIDFEKHLVRMKDILSNSGSKLAIIVFPIEAQFNESYLSEDYDYVLKPQRSLKDLCDRYDVPCLDLFQSFYDRQKQGVDLFRDSLHLSEDGHRFAGEEILEFLATQELLTRN